MTGTVPHHVVVAGVMLAVAGVAAAPRPAAGQVPNTQPPAAARPAARAEVVRGRVVDDSARAVPGATVVVTRGPDRLVRQTTSDSAGRFAVRFDEGTGDYLVAVSAPGFQTARRRVQRQASERELVADFRLGRGVATLAGVNVRAQRPERPTNVVRPTTPDPGASERWAEGVEGQVPPTVAGDLGALAGTIPGVTLTPSGASILGSGAASTLTTLNGLGFPGAAVPRAARVDTRVTSATFDPTRGGFAGANVDVRLGPGSRDYQNRVAYGTVDTRALQARTDAVGRALGVRGDNLRASVGLDGELIRRVLTYNVALDVARATSDPATLLDADPAVLARFGAAPDSAARLLAAAGTAGLPLHGTGVPATRRRDAVTWLGRLDDTRDSLRWRTLTTYAGVTREGAIGLGPLAAPSAGAARQDRTFGAQLVAGQYAGPGHRVWNETRLSASIRRASVAPYGTLPGATVLVPSGVGETGDVAGLALGGSAFLASDERRWTAEGANETIWQARGRRHRFKALAWARADGLAQRAVPNAFGTFAFNSVADFAAGRAASFTRTLAQPTREGTVWNGAAALAHQWAPSRYFSLLYGARLEGNAFGARPADNPALAQALGVRTGVAPARLHVSPRAGFTWTYNRARDNGAGMSMNSTGTYYRPTSGVLRGGIGEFRDLLRPDVLADARVGTGLPGSTTVLSCVGAAVPAVDWARFAADPLAAPTECAGGGGVLAERAPAVTLLAPRYDVPRSWRASLDWNTTLGAWAVRLGGLASYDLAQPGTVDANFAGVPRFALGAEGGRPVFVPAAAVDSASGSVSPAASRRTADFGAVSMRTSDLRGYGGQLTAQLAPDVFRFRRNRSGSLFGSLAYTVQATRRQFRGFDGANFGDPRVREWAPGPNDARHAVVLQGGFSTRTMGTVTVFARAQSGLPFTPVVQGDVDGDGRGGDRAFVPEPVGEPDSALAAAVRALRTGGSPEARACLARYAGRVPARNGCRGPWTQTLNVQWAPPLPKRWGERLRASVYFQNVLGGVDQFLHGEGGLRGWGTAGTPDPILLVPRGFDAAAGGPNGPRFRYDVNPRFGTARGARSLVREPFRVTLDIRLDFATPYPVQQLRRVLEPVRVAGRWERRSADSILAQYLKQTSDIHRALLAESDSLFLTADQIARLRRADSTFSDSVRALYAPLARYLAARPSGAFGRAELDSVTRVEKAYWRLFWRQPEIADSALSRTQRQLFPLLESLLGVPEHGRERNRSYFGSPVLLLPPRSGQSVP